MGINTQQAEDLKSIAAMSDEVISTISENADSYDGDLTDSEAIQNIISFNSTFSEENLKSISSAITGLFYAYIASDQQDDEFIDQLLYSINESDVSFSEAELANLKCNLSKLFRTTSLFVAYKAHTLVMESERLMTDVRVLTDIRPVFGQIAVDDVLGYAISHTLKISYQDSRGSGEFYVALDSSDLLSLKETIDREIKKQETIKARTGIYKKGFVRD